MHIVFTVVNPDALCRLFFISTPAFYPMTLNTLTATNFINHTQFSVQDITY